MMPELEKLTDDEIISTFSKCIKELRKREIIKTKNVVGELGEHYTVEYFRKTKGLPKLDYAPVGTESYDAIDRKGKRYSIKSITGTTTGVVYGLNDPGSSKNNEKIFDYMLICKLDDDYHPTKIYQLDWDTFNKYKRWHSRMKAWNISLSKKLAKECIIYDL